MFSTVVLLCINSKFSKIYYRIIAEYGICEGQICVSADVPLIYPISHDINTSSVSPPAATAHELSDLQCKLLCERITCLMGALRFLSIFPFENLKKQTIIEFVK
jgi:hypothetical protein